MYIARRKRIVKLHDSEIDFGDFYLTDFMCPKCYGAECVMWEGWDRLSELYKRDPETYVSLMRQIGHYNMYVKELWNVVNLKIGYREDDPVFQTPDYWMIPNETWKQLKGDCEDTTFLLLSAVYRVKRGWAGDEVADEAIEYGCIGYYIDYLGNAYGHGFMIRKSCKIANGKWLWVETTLDEEVPQSIWYLVDFDSLIPVYFFTDRECFRVDKDYGKLGLDESYVNKYRDLIDAMVDYVEFGKRLKVKWMHKHRRPARIPSAKAIYLI